MIRVGINEKTSYFTKLSNKLMFSQVPTLFVPQYQLSMFHHLSLKCQENRDSSHVVSSFGFAKRLEKQ